VRERERERDGGGSASRIQTGTVIGGLLPERKLLVR
jgi:hypothetical protein